MSEEKTMDELFEDGAEDADEGLEDVPAGDDDDAGENDGDVTDNAEEDNGEGSDGDDDGDDELARIKDLYEKEKAKSEAAQKSADDRAAKILKELGYASEDDFWAEREGKSVDEYRAKIKNDQILKEAEEIVNQKKYAEWAAKDLATLKDLGYVSKDTANLRDIPNVKRFAQLRQLGATAEEAYRAVNADQLEERSERAARARSTGKEHLTPHKSRPGAAKGSVMSASDREMFKSLLHTDDDKAIEAAWKRANAQN